MLPGMRTDILLAAVCVSAGFAWAYVMDDAPAGSPLREIASADARTAQPAARAPLLVEEAIVEEAIVDDAPLDEAIPVQAASPVRRPSGESDGTAPAFGWPAQPARATPPQAYDADADSHGGTAPAFGWPAQPARATPPQAYGADADSHGGTVPGAAYGDPYVPSGRARGLNDEQMGEAMRRAREAAAAQARDSGSAQQIQLPSGVEQFFAGQRLMHQQHGAR
jgi:hypothetical protein